jgi:uncharacterized RDD family membrane protein YckC
MINEPMMNTDQPSLRYASFQHRLGAIVLDATLMVITLGIGWLIWSFIVWGEGQTPAKKILKLRTINFTNGRPATWGHMGIREGLIPITVSIASDITDGPLVNSFGQVMGTNTFKIRGADGFNVAKSASLLCKSLVACNDPIWNN